MHETGAWRGFKLLRIFSTRRASRVRQIALCLSLNLPQNVAHVRKREERRARVW